MCTVGIKKGSRNIHYLLTAPHQHKPRLFCDRCNLDSLQILLRRICKKRICILRVHNDCHTLLRLGNRKLRSVQSRILFRHLVHIDNQTIRKLADCHGNTARTEIVALLNQLADLRTPEQSLQFALRRSISFLNLRTARRKRRRRVHLRRPCRAAAAVASRTTAEQNDNIVRIRCLPDDTCPRRRRHHRPDFHTLCHIIGMIHLFDISRRKSNLISVRRIAARRAAHKLFLRKLAPHGFLHRHRRVCRSGYTHRLINIRSSRKGITDCTAKTRCRSAERLNFRRVIVRLVLKVDKPFLRDNALSVLLVNLHRNDNRAGINLVRLLHVFKLSVLFELAHRHQRQIHQADILVLSASKNFLTRRQILLISGLDRLRIIAFLKCNIL